MGQKTLGKVWTSRGTLEKVRDGSGDPPESP